MDANRRGLLVQGNDGSNYQDVAVNSSGHVLVDVQDAEIAVNIEGDYVDDAAFTVASDRGLAIGGVVSADTLDSGDFGVAQMSTSRELYTSADVRNVGGNAASTGSGTVDSGTLRVVLPTDQPVISIDDNAGSLTVDASQLDIDDLNSTDDEVGIGDGTNSLVVNSDGSLNVVQAGGNPTPSYGTANLVKDSATTVHSYSPGAGTDHLKKIEVSGSGKMKVEILYGTTASEAVQQVKFNSTAEPNVEFDMQDQDIASTQTVIVQCTNLEDSASPASDFDGYATIWYRD